MPTSERGESFCWEGLPYVEMRDTLPVLVQDVHAGARRIERIVDDLRHFARPRPQGTLAPFQLNEAVERALRLLTHLISRKATHVAVELAEALPLVQGDEQLVEQIIVNIVVNALEALPESGGEVTVSTAFNPAAHRVMLAVRDDGMGIPQEHLARLSDPFFTTKYASGGTGLGLAITAKWNEIKEAA